MSGLTGIDEPYEPPLEPDLRYVSDGSETPDAAVARITDHLVRLGYLPPAPDGPSFASHS
jgi:adenylylsulfate kinase-like enzyme